MTRLVGPQLLPIAFNAEIANWGDSVSVPCSILKGDMPMDISWAFNGVPIDTSKDTGITITRISKHLSTLSIDGVSARHAGEYACSASNLAGSVSRSTTLTVNGTTLNFLANNRFIVHYSHEPRIPPSIKYLELPLFVLAERSLYETNAYSTAIPTLSARPRCA